MSPYWRVFLLDAAAARLELTRSAIRVGLIEP